MCRPLVSEGENGNQFNPFDGRGHAFGKAPATDYLTFSFPIISKSVFDKYF